jgi:hypothetical protein
MDLQKEDIRKKLYEFGCGYMLDEYMKLFNEIGKIYHKKQLHIPVVSQQRELFLELLEFVDNDLEQTTCEWLNEQFVDEFINSKNCG